MQAHDDVSESTQSENEDDADTQVTAGVGAAAARGPAAGMLLRPSSPQSEETASGTDTDEGTCIQKAHTDTLGHRRMGGEASGQGTSSAPGLSGSSAPVQPTFPPTLDLPRSIIPPAPPALASDAAAAQAATSSGPPPPPSAPQPRSQSRRGAGAGSRGGAASSSGAGAASTSGGAGSVSNRNPGAGPGAGGPAPRAAPRRPAGSITMKSLIDAGFLIPGDQIVYVEYKGNVTRGDLNSEGQIVCGGMVFESPSAFSIYIKRLVNPTRKADDGWKAVKYEGKLLEHYKDEYLRHKYSAMLPGSRPGTPPPPPLSANGAPTVPAGPGSRPGSVPPSTITTVPPAPPPLASSSGDYPPQPPKRRRLSAALGLGTPGEELPPPAPQLAGTGPLLGSGLPVRPPLVGSSSVPSLAAADGIGVHGDLLGGPAGGLGMGMVETGLGLGLHLLPGAGEVPPPPALQSEQVQQAAHAELQGEDDGEDGTTEDAEEQELEYLR